MTTMEKSRDYESDDSSRMPKRLKNKEAKNNTPTRFYHATTHRFKVGDTLLPLGEQSEISLTDSPIPHHTIAFERIKPEPWFRQGQIEQGAWRSEWDGKWYVYEVKPTSKVRYMAEEMEARTDRAEIVKFVGDARAILENHLKKVKRKPNEHRATSAISNFNNVRGIKTVGRGPGTYWLNEQNAYKNRATTEIRNAIKDGDFARLKGTLLHMPRDTKFEGPEGQILEIAFPNSQEVDAIDKSKRSKKAVALLAYGGKFEIFESKKDRFEKSEIEIFIKKFNFAQNKVVLSLANYDEAENPIPDRNNEILMLMKKDFPTIDFRVIFKALNQPLVLKILKK